MDYAQAQAYLDKYTDWEKVGMPHDPANYDLRRVDELLARLGNPQLTARTVHIAGTKGKGSTSAMTAAVLTAAGYRTGLFAKPHLITVRERFQMDGRLISEDEFVALVERVRPEVEAVNARPKYGKITTFELLTVMGFTYASAQRADFQVLETGLGGTYDATNVIRQPEVCVITSISYDHMDVLGDTLAQIAGEKAGIIKPGVTLVTGPQPYAAEVDPVLDAACRRMGARRIRVGQDVTWEAGGFNLGGQRLRVKGRLDSYDITIPLLGNYQLDNTATVVATLEVLQEKGDHITKESIVRGLARASWPGRFQIINRSPLMLVDGAHNADSCRRLRESLAQYFQPARKILVTGASSDKDLAGMVKELAPYFQRAIITRANHPRAMATERITAEFARYGLPTEVVPDTATAFTRARAAAGRDGLVCFTGSLFIVGEAIAEAQKQGLVVK